MTSPAEAAVNNSISFECKKDALQQRQSGDWKVSFTIQGTDMDERLTRAAMGARFVAVLVEVNDDETPKEQPRGRIDWREVQPAAQAGIRCAEPRFRAYLAAEHGIATKTAQEAAEAVRTICGVNSRSEFSTDQRKRVLWHQLDSGYREWARV
jgi:hypothetical protein